MDFGNIFKKLIPLGIAAGTAYMAGGSMGSSGSLFASSSWKDKLAQWGIQE